MLGGAMKKGTGVIREGRWVLASITDAAARSACSRDLFVAGWCKEDARVIGFTHRV